jgi:ABC-2 type transport system permease protein
MKRMNKFYIFLQSTILIIKKNLKVHINEPPLYIFGILFPLFLFLSFYIGRDINFRIFFPGLAGMTLFFLCTSIGPVITPFEKFYKTYERLLTFPLNLKVIIFGDILTGMLFGTVISFLVIIPGIILLQYNLNIFFLILNIFIAGFCFATIGNFIASAQTHNPGNIMIRATLIRFTLIFLSGVFIPFKQLHIALKVLAHISPLTYFIDLVNDNLLGECARPAVINYLALVIFSFLFTRISFMMQKKSMDKL